jgi:LCP family protein required for cell wall assembly
VLVGGTTGGAYLYLHESVAAVAPKTAEVKKALEKLDIALPASPQTALMIGYDHRADEAKNTPSRSDTLMLVRADPGEKTISLPSFPRDLSVEIHCPGHTPFVSKINAGVCDVRTDRRGPDRQALTGVPINYSITVNFRGFRQLVDKLGGVWLDVDRRYFNDHGGRRATRRSTSSPATSSSTATRRSTSSASATPTPTSTATRASSSSCGVQGPDRVAFSVTSCRR